MWKGLNFSYTKIQSFLTDTVNVEFDTREDGNEKVLTITTTSAPTETGITEEQQVEEDSSDDNGDDNGNGKGRGMTNHLKNLKNQNNLQISHQYNRMT